MMIRLPYVGCRRIRTSIGISKDTSSDLSADDGKTEYASHSGFVLIPMVSLRGRSSKRYSSVFALCVKQDK